MRREGLIAEPRRRDLQTVVVDFNNPVFNRIFRECAGHDVDKV